MKKIYALSLFRILKVGWSLFVIGLILIGYIPGRDAYQIVNAATYNQVSAGGLHTCALRADGNITCWGWNGDNQCTVPAGSYTQVDAGGTHTCAIKSDQSIVCWGNNVDGQATAPAGTYKQVSAGGNHTCAIKSDGSIECWGSDSDGQASPPGGTDYVAVSAGGNHTCARKTDGSIVCWGSDSDGQVSTKPGETGYSQLTAGENHNCALAPDNSIFCWGNNDNGKATPPGGTNYQKVRAGYNHTCALKSDNSITCWGLDSEGQSSPPTGTDYSSLSAGGNHTCAVKNDNSIVCWGSDSEGQSSVPANIPPSLDNPIPDQTITANTSYNYVVPANTFSDGDGDALTYSASRSDDSALPSWLSFNAATRTFSGTPTNSNAGVLNLKVTVNDGRGGSASDTFTLTINPATDITSFSPTKAAAGSVITIYGVGFTNATSVSFGGVAAAQFTVSSDTKILAIVSTSGASGNVVVVSPSGTGTKSGFIFIPPPIITDFTPKGAKAGDTVIITGQYLSDASSVKFGGVEAASFTVNSDTKITAVVGNGNTGYITVITPGGIGTLDQTFYITRTATPGNTFTPTKSNTPTISQTPTRSQTPTLNPTSFYLSRTPTRTITRTPTRSSTPSRTPSQTYTPTVFQTPTDTLSPTIPAPTLTPTIPPYIEYENGPINLSLTNFTVSRFLENFATFGPVRALESTILWVEIRNLGPEPFVPSPDGSHYSIILTLKDAQGRVLEEKSFSSTSTPPLEPLTTLAPGGSQVLRIDGIVFSHSVPGGTLTVTLKPEFDIPSAVSKMTRQVTIEQIYDSCTCNSKLLEAVVGSAENLSGTENPPLTGLLEQTQSWTCTADNAQKLEQLSQWYINLMVTAKKGSDYELFNAALDAGQAIYGSTSCATPADWLRAFLKEMIVAQRMVTGIITESPVYPRIINSNNQVTGFMDDGTVVETIPSSRAAQIGETRAVFVSAYDAKNQIQIIGYATGVMDLTVFLSSSPGSATQSRYLDIPIQDETVIMLRLADKTPNLSYFRGNSVSAEHAIPPNETLSIPSGQAVENPIPFAPFEKFLPYGGIAIGICLCLPLLVVGVVAVITLVRKRRRSKAANEVEGLDIADETFLDQYGGLDTSTRSAETPTRSEIYEPPAPTIPLEENKPDTDEDQFLWELDDNQDK